jgi:2-dehydro-3-deoxyphosphooctonate aldolase (KDO 8-P synthase)
VAQFFAGGTFTLIAGPCVLENDELNLRVADHLARLQLTFPGQVIFKASFDKANRSREGAARGPGLDTGLEQLRRAGASSGLPLLTDVHLPEHCAAAAEVVDVLQIPAFLCRQTDLLIAAGVTGKPVNVKKGQWMSAESMSGALEKVRNSRPSGTADATAVTERGTFFGYGDLVVDMRSIRILADSCNAAVIFDATHSVQKPGMGAGGASGGAREFVPLLAAAAVAAGADGIFMEVHPDPGNAPSDGSNMMPLAELDALVSRLVQIRAAARE